ncbi:chemotaxis protein methyltransferase CheR [Thermotomaculum hydrothermale]|uniref:protein-glutamate O-methyltransferase n=1 Tax=Thermotomaculum hydrothermale TaxID=981385 RepID=A0A7R6PVK8_9BACT|nr:protein-glutamate O-methyltransferase CheR [Thermotomaculum hydrothermale]BBB33432.1 chemotaxis protein methyltransferase CheR [Thermotomaculum hydrothermale]
MINDRLNDLKLNREIFNIFARLIREKCGLFFDLSKMYFLETKLKKRMAERGITDFITYYNLLKNDYTDREFKELLNEITIHETAFFRINSHFKTFSDYVLPGLVARKNDSGSLYLSFLSAGCSTGEEAYSIALSVFEKMKEFPQKIDFSVVGIDISISAIERARNGIYSENDLNSVPENIIEKYFEKVDNGFKVKDFVKEKVVFRYANLYKKEDIELIGRFDAVFCRYVLIYFDELAKTKLLDNIYSVLNPGGMLFVAPSESYNVPENFARINYKNSIVFEKPL